MGEFVTRSLTLRELEILASVAMGASAKEMARQFAITSRTVETHINHIKLKTGARNRAHIVALAHQQGLFATPPPPNNGN